MLLGGLFLVLLVFLGLDVSQVQVTTGHILELLAVIFAEITHHPLVDAVRQNQYLNALLAEHLQVRAALGRREVVRSDVVDLLLALLHPADVIIQRHILGALTGISGGKTQQAGNLLAVAEVLGRAFLQYRAELAPELLVLLGVFLRQFGEHVQNPLGDSGTDAFHGAVVLQDLPGHVQGQIVGINHALGEPQVQRQELLSVVHDEHTLHVKLQTTGRFPVVHIKRRAGRNIQQAGVIQLAFHLVVGPGQRVFKIVSDVLVELLVLLVLDLGTRERPERCRIVDGFVLVFLFTFVGFSLHHHREGDMIRVLLHQTAQFPTIGEFLGVWFQMQDDLGTAIFPIDLLNGKLAVALGLPMHTLFCGCTGTAGKHIHLISHDKRRVETDTELTDQLAVLFLVAGKLLEEFGGTGTGNGAQVLDDVVTGHADAVVGQGNGIRLFVKIQTNLQLRIAFIQAVILQSGETKFIFSIGSVRNQLTKEDFLIGIQRVNHQVKQLLHFSLESKRLFIGFNRHGVYVS